MAEACMQFPSRTTPITATPLMRIVASPTNSPSELTSLPGEQASHDYQGRIAELEAELCAVRERDARARLIVDSATDYAIITMDADGCVTSWNVGAQAIMGYAEAEILGRSGDVIFTAEDRSNGRFTTELRRAAETGRASNERWHLRRDGTRFWASGLMMPLLDAHGQPHGFLNILRDRTEVQAAVERRELLMAEMSHRINNTFALVQAVAMQTRRHTETVAEFGTVFGARLGVLARSNEVLTRANWHDTPLGDVIESALAAHGGEPGRITVEGPSVLLGANLAVAVSLSFHELATNAVKYGALSVPAGRVGISWTTGRTRKGACKVDIVWRERGGPMVEPPVRRGFGSHLLEKGVPSGGRVKLDFRPRGLECRMCLPLSNATYQGASP
jgi:PAS domain S-box-containing protein